MKKSTTSKVMRYNYYKTSVQRAFYLHPTDFAVVVKAVRMGGFKSVAAFASQAVFRAAVKIIEKNKK